MRENFLRSLRQGLFADSGWLLADRVIRIVVGVLVNIALARALGATDFGLLATALSLAALFLPLSTLGGERIVIRELARGNLEESDALVSFGAVRLAGGLLGCLLATGVAWLFVAPDNPNALAAVLLVGLGNVLMAFDTVDWVFQARGDFRGTTLARLGAFLIGALIKLTLVAAGAGVVLLAAAVAIELAVTAIAQVLVWRRRGGRWPALRLNPAKLRFLLLAGAPLLVAEVAVWAFQRLDLVLLTTMIGGEIAGWYAVAQRLAQVGYFLPVLAVQVLSPRVAKATTDAEALAIVQSAANLLVLGGLSLSALLVLLGGPLVALMFGPGYGMSVGALQVLAWNNVFVFLGCAHSLFLVNRNRQALSLRLTWLTAGVSVIMNLLLIPRLQLVGAAWASLLTYAITTTLGVGCFRESRPLFWVNLRALASPVTMIAGLVRKRPSPRA